MGDGSAWGGVLGRFGGTNEGDERESLPHAGPAHTCGGMHFLWARGRRIKKLFFWIPNGPTNLHLFREVAEFAKPTNILAIFLWANPRN